MNIRCAAVWANRGVYGARSWVGTARRLQLWGSDGTLVESDPPVAEGGEKRRTRCGVVGEGGRVSMRSVSYGYQYGGGRVGVVR